MQSIVSLWEMQVGVLMHTVMLEEGLGNLTQLWRDGRERCYEGQETKYRKGVGDAETDPAKTSVETPFEARHWQIRLTMLWP